MRTDSKAKTRHHGGGGPPSPPPIPDRIVTTTKSGSGDGTITEGLGAVTVPDGTTVTRTANPDASSDFGGWTGAITSSSNPVSVTVNSDITINAVFTAVGSGGSNPDDTGVALIDNHMGSLNKSDLCSAIDPCPNLWISVTDPYVYNPYSSAFPAADDPYIKRYDSSTAAIDPHIARGQITQSPYWRRIHADQTIQDKYDDGSWKNPPVPINQSTRTQLVHNSTSQTFWLGAEGKRYWYMFSHRRHGHGQLADTNGNAIQVCQWKAPQAGGGGTQPILAIGEKTSGYQFIWHDWYAPNNPKLYYQIPFTSNNLWVRFWCDIKWSANPANATFTIWTDVNGGAPERIEKMPVTGQRTLFDSAQPSNWSHGIYSSPATDLNGTLNGDYANLQVCDYSP